LPLEKFWNWQLSLGHSDCCVAKEINPMELIYIASQGTHYNLACLLKMQYEPRTEEIMEGEILTFEGGRHFDDRKRTGRFNSTSQLSLTFCMETPDVVHLTGEEADKVYKEIMNMSRQPNSTKETSR
jgi:hypothetical protein